MRVSTEQLNDTAGAGTNAPAVRQAVHLDIDRLIDRANGIRTLYADEPEESVRLDVIARVFLVHVTSAIHSQLGEDTHDKVVRALGFDHLARDMNRSRSKQAACAELPA